MAITNETLWQFSLHLIQTWWPPLREHDRVPEVMIQAAEERLGFQIPKALRDWYALAGTRMDFMGNQDHLVAIENLDVIDGVLVFAWENQGVVQWGVRQEDVENDDPPVVGTTDELFDENNQVVPGEWTQSATSVSLFLQTMVVEATLMSGVFSGRGQPVDAVVVAAVEREYDRLPFTLGCLERLYTDDDTLVGFWRTSKGQLLMDVSMRCKASVEKFLCCAGCGVQIGHLNGAHGNQYGHNYSPACRDVGPPYILRLPYPQGVDLPDTFPDCKTLVQDATGTRWESIRRRFLGWFQGHGNATIR